MRTRGACQVVGCERQHYGLGMCALHYQRSRRGQGQIVETAVERDARRNPWAHRSPSCPNGHPPADVYLWTPDPERWICPPCRKVFAA